MKRLNKILVVLYLMPFLFSTTGVLVYQTNCSCTGQEEISLFFSPKTCEDHFHITDHDHYPSIEEEGFETVKIEGNFMDHLRSCGCSSLVVKFFKLKSLSTEDAQEYIKSDHKVGDFSHMIADYFKTEYNDLPENPVEFETNLVFKFPGRKIILLNCQYKLPHIA